jgi:hypothetical protein
MSSPSAGIAGIINTASLATSGVDLFVGRIPEDNPNFAIGVLEAGGPAPNPKWVRDDYDLQIIVRGDVNGYSAAWDKAIAIKNLLLGHAPATVGSDIYARFIMRGNVGFIGYDSLQRPKFSSNWRITIDGVAVGNRLEIA